MIASRRFFKPILRLLANLKLSILLLLLIAAFSSLGTFIEQDLPINFYKNVYPEQFIFNWRIIEFFGLNHIYKTWWFLTLLILFGMSLLSCTILTQFPILKVARQWKFENSSLFKKSKVSNGPLENDSSENLMTFLNYKNYHTFQKASSFYAQKGVVGRVSPILVHLSIILILIGAFGSAFGGFVAQETVPSGESSHIQNIITLGPLTKISQNPLLRVNQFWINYRPDKSIDQFYSDISVLNTKGDELKRETIYVNHPLRFQNIMIYQTNWNVTGVLVAKQNGEVIQAPVEPLDAKSKDRVWKVKLPENAPISIFLKDLSGEYFIFQSSGGLEPRNISSPNGTDPFQLREVIAETGLQIKADPGIPIIYAGFGFLMLSIVLSYVSYSQVWFSGVTLPTSNLKKYLVKGKTNRAMLNFEKELKTLVNNSKLQ